MALVRRNNNLNMMAVPAARATGAAIGSMMISPTGAKLFWTGMDWVLNKTWQKIKNQFKSRKTDMILHPGAYPGAIAAPVAVTRVIRGSKPKFTRSKGAVTITHRELVGQYNNSAGLVVNGSVGGTIYKLNPSNALLFPWLQSIASNFDQYKFDNVKLTYIPMCATTETGRVALYFDKDSQDPVPADRVELANMFHLRETAPWAESNLNVPTDNVKRFTNDNTTTDLKLVDLGQIGIATYGGSGTNPVGDLFIHYTVTFFEPQPSAGIVETEQTGAGALDSGPDMVSVGGDAISTLIVFKTPGTFILTLGQRNTTLGTVVPTGVTVNSSTHAQATGFCQSIVNLTVSTPGGILQYNGTGFGNRTVNIVRAKVTNRVDII
uniref:Coat protein n=1 Tax=Pelargonium necrotic spot virus TaxID=255587 RepID=A0A8E8FUS4_PENSV|nr:coat protein [Pelargonium necrotic spot virus]